jgi:hypothetical protein
MMIIDYKEYLYQVGVYTPQSNPLFPLPLLPLPRLRPKMKKSNRTFS